MESRFYFKKCLENETLEKWRADAFAAGIAVFAFAAGRKKNRLNFVQIAKNCNFLLPQE